MNDFDNYADLYNGVTAAQIRAAAEEPAANARVITDIAADLGTDADAVTASTEGDITAGTRTNAQTVQQSAVALSQAGTYGVAALHEFAAHVEAFDTSVAELNQRLRTNAAWSQRLAGQAAAENDEDPPEYTETWAAARAALQPEYNRAVATLDDNADATASRFEQGPTPANIRELYLAGLLPYTALTALWPSIGVSAQDRFDAYQAAVANGTIPAIEDMTEAERQAFLRDNPSILEDWTQIADPPAELQDAIIRLALPVVDDDDADSDASRIIWQLENGRANPNIVSQALDDLAAINAGLALLTPWATRNDVDLAASAPVQTSQDYLRTFYEQTYSHKDEIVEFINSDEHSWQTSYTVSDGTHYTEHSSDGYSTDRRQELMSAYADGILNLSNHDVGGGWDQLPQALRDDAQQVFSTKWLTAGNYPVEVQVENDDFRSLAELLSYSTTEPGDGLAKQMGSTAAASMAAHENFWSDQPGKDRQGAWSPDIAADVFDMISRNQHASLDLIAGTDTPVNRPGNFNSIVFNHPWDLENGNEAKVAKLYANLTPDVDHLDTDTRDAVLAETRQALAALSGDLTDVEGGNFENLMGKGDETDPEDVVSAAWRNTLLTRELTDAVGANLDIFAAEPGIGTGDGIDLSDAERTRLFTFIASDRVGDDPSTFDYNRGAAQLSAYVQAHQQDAVNQYVQSLPADGRSEMASQNGRLQGLLDAGVINEAATRGIFGQDAENERIQNIKTGSALLNQAISVTPGVNTVLGPFSSTGNTIVANFLQADDITSPAAELSPNWQPGGFHLSADHSMMMLEALVRAGEIPASDVPPQLAPDDGDVSGLSTGAIDDLARPVLADYFSTNPPYDDQVMPNITTWLTTGYNGILDSYAITDPERILTDPRWDGS